MKAGMEGGNLRLVHSFNGQPKALTKINNLFFQPLYLFGVSNLK